MFVELRRRIERQIKDELESGSDFDIRLNCTREDIKPKGGY